jgi:hypothetical protein
MHNMNVPIEPVSPAATASFHHQPTEDLEVQEVDRSQVSNNKGRRRLPSEENHSARRNIEHFAQHFCMLARMLL